MADYISGSVGTASFSNITDTTATSVLSGSVHTLSLIKCTDKPSEYTADKPYRLYNQSQGTVIETLSSTNGTFNFTNLESSSIYALGIYGIDQEDMWESEGWWIAGWFKTSYPEISAKFIKDENGNVVSPITSVDSIFNADGSKLSTKLKVVDSIGSVSEYGSPTYFDISGIINASDETDITGYFPNGSYDSVAPRNKNKYR